MFIIIFLVVAVYSSLMVYMLAKVGSLPAKSVLDLWKMKQVRSQSKPEKSYEQTISIR
ncbi:hypothetical protein [Halobacillus karajensis]|uniref:Uncharacterized protein n=1 Tax=Halobacillus karajensis TaxID=195088 RepID=A0A024P169_9BACI|nr:hypothetical protein [Halobacillus karajensis]CDQ19552.1 hypothetical protein BN982_01849 [Halobacillus karajensis]CDQ22014.1 hypothetical protein BN983_00212 [Halobacillus karajensis]CDQ27855.1 hypothetical protein BN981_02139 [Halobacillus karajensis]